MFRVPTDPTHPSFDQTFKVGFFRWLRSSKVDRLEWRRRRNAAAELAGEHQRAAITERRRRLDAEAADRKRQRDEQ
jgi:hypothetical protein